MLLTGFIAHQDPDQDGDAYIVVALPDGSHITGKVRDLPRGSGPRDVLNSNIVLSQNSSGTLNTVLTAFQNCYHPTLIVTPRTVSAQGDHTVDDGVDLVGTFIDAYEAGHSQQEYMRLNPLKVGYETTVFTGEPAGARARRRPRTRVEDRDPAIALDPGEVLTRPNGETYLPRRLVGHTDAAVLRRARGTRMFALLRGEPGTGKTALADAAFPDLISVGCDGDTTVSHLVGSWIPNPDGTFRWNDGPLTTAMKEGRVLLLDEIASLPHEVAIVLYSAIDGRGMLRINDRPDLPAVHAAEGFYVIGTYNPHVLGNKPLPEAMLSRFTLQIEVDTDFDVPEQLGVPEKFVGLARTLRTRSRQQVADGGEPVWYPKTRELLGSKRFLDNGFGEAFALAALIEQCPVPEDLPIIREEAKNTFGSTPGTMTLGAHVSAD